LQVGVLWVLTVIRIWNNRFRGIKRANPGFVGTGTRPLALTGVPRRMRSGNWKSGARPYLRHWKLETGRRPTSNSQRLLTGS
jgi:hypothetical protein